MNSPKNIKLLIVDDSPISIFDLKYKLKGIVEEKNILVAKNYNNAINILKEKQIDIALIDLQMPDAWNGVDLIVHIRESNKLKDLPVIVITSTKINGLLQKSIENMVSDYLQKPVKQNLLKPAIINSIKSNAA